jgi:hypothetical protein
MRSEIEDGFLAWNFGGFNINRGASFQFSIGSDMTTDSDSDGIYSIIFPTQAQWDALVASGVISSTAGAYTRIAINNTNCTVTDRDLFINPGGTFKSEVPSKGNVDAYSLSQLVMHEAGHGLGLDHATSIHSLMEATSPFGGDHSAKDRVHEDDASFMMSEYPGFSTGHNVMANKYGFSSTQVQSCEQWTISGGSGTNPICSSADAGFYKHPLDPPTWSWCPGDLISGSDKFGRVHISHTGPGTTGTVHVRWTLSASGNCKSSSNLQVGAWAGTMTTNTPNALQPTLFMIPNTAGNDSLYRLCVYADADGAVVETAENDNTAKSEAYVYIKPATECL